MKVSDVMTSPAVWVSPDTKVREVIMLLIRHRISCAPVVDDEMHLLGIVSQADVFLREKVIPFSLVRALTLFNEWVDSQDLERPHPELDHYTAGDVMSRKVYCVDAADELKDAAVMMVLNDVKRVPVLSGGKVVGMLTRHDLIRRIAISLRADSTPA